MHDGACYHYKGITLLSIDFNETSVRCRTVHRHIKITTYVGQSFIGGMQKKKYERYDARMHITHFYSNTVFAK